MRTGEALLKWDWKPTQSIGTPRTFMPLRWAWFTIWSAEPKVKEPRVRSVASHFISFSGVTELNSVLSVETYGASPRWFAATAAPK